MDNRFIQIPPQGRPKRFGQPYHGLVENGDLTLSTGVKLAFPGTSGDCYKVVVPGTPALEMTPTEIAVEAAAGREWRTYALLSGRNKNYGGIQIGADAWLYAAPDGTVWRIRCPQLNATTITPTRLPGFDWGYYPATVDFRFEISRFGVISPDGAPDTAVVIKAGQLIGPATGWRSDHFRDPAEGSPIAAANRRYPGDGLMVQYMPINIDDVSSDGSKCLICCNRSGEQSAGNLSISTGRAYPLSWLEIRVSGAGSASSISISMSLVRSNPTEEDYVTTLDVSHTTVDDGLQVQSIDITYTDDHGDTAIACQQRTGIAWTTTREVESGRKWTIDVPLRAAGGYYDGSDVLQWATIGPVHIVDESTGTGTYSPGSMITRETVIYTTDGHGPFTQIEGAWVLTYTASAHQLVTADVPVSVGGHSFAVPQLNYEGSASGGRMGLLPESDFDTGLSTTITYSGGGTLRCVFGEFTHTASDWFWFGGISIDLLLWTGNGCSWGTTMGAYVLPPNVMRSIHGRTIDHVRLVRMTNKTYGLIADGEAEGWPFNGQTRILAICSPNGWTTINSAQADYFASFNPGTGQLATSATKIVSWV